MPVSDLMHRADVALSRAKLDGRRCVRTFEPEMDAEMRSRVLLERDLRQAVAQDAVVPHYQPLVNLRTGALVGFEVLARWPHPTRGMVPPDVFIPLAEDLGLIGALSERLMRQPAAKPQTGRMPSPSPAICRRCSSVILVFQKLFATSSRDRSPSEPS